MEKFKKYGGWGLGVIAILLFGVVLVKAAIGGYLINVENWNGDVNVADPSGSPVRLGADDGTHITKLSVLETLDVTSTVTFSGALSVGGAITGTGTSTITNLLADNVLCFKSGSVYYKFVASTTASVFSYTSSSASALCI